MKIKLIQNDIKVKGAKFATGERPDNLEPFLNNVNCSAIIGLPGSGKSSLIKTLLYGTQESNLYNNVFNSVYYISPSQTMDLNLPDEKIISLADNDNLAQILEDIIENESNLGEEDDPHRVAIFIDDAINWINGDKKSMNIFKKICMNGRHLLKPYSSLQTFIVSQKIRSIPLQIRSQLNQIWFYNSTKKEKEVFSDEFLPLDLKESELLYDFVFDEPYNFLFVNLLLPKNKRIFKNFSQIELL